MPHRVTINDIARITGLSRSTVSRALIEPPVDINPETRAYILSVCEREGYQANSLARSLVSHRSHVLGLVLPDVTNPYYAELALHLDACADARGYSLMLCNTQCEAQRTEKLLDFLAGRQVDGAILAGSAHSARRSIAQRADRLPIVLLGVPAGDAEAPDSARINAVSADHFSGGCMGAAHLYELGHRDILFFGLRPGSLSQQQRYQGYLSVMRAHGLSPRVLESPYPACSLQYGYQLAQELFRDGCPSTAIFATSDTMALGVVQAADEAGIRIPDDISLLGFDNSSYSILPDLALSTIDVHKRAQAEAAIDLLIGAIDSREVVEITQQLIRPTLLARDSTRSI